MAVDDLRQLALDRWRASLSEPLLRESRGRVAAPLNTSIGAVRVYPAKRSADPNRLTSPDMAEDLGH
jgi:hypothetical protein